MAQQFLLCWRLTWERSSIPATNIKAEIILTCLIRLINFDKFEKKKSNLYYFHNLIIVIIF